MKAHIPNMASPRSDLYAVGGAQVTRQSSLETDFALGDILAFLFVFIKL